MFSSPSASRRVQVLAITGHVSGPACVLNLGDVPPRIGLAAVEIGEAVDLCQLAARQRFPASPSCARAAKILHGDQGEYNFIDFRVLRGREK